MIATVIKWRDACSEQADEPNTPVETRLLDLTEIGWIINETDDAVSIAMELEDNDPSRWRLHIPKRNIIQRIDFEVPKLPPRARALRGPKPSNRRVNEAKGHQLVGDGRDVHAVPDRLRGRGAGEGLRHDAHSDPARPEGNG